MYLQIFHFILHKKSIADEGDFHTFEGNRANNNTLRHKIVQNIPNIWRVYRYVVLL